MPRAEGRALYEAGRAAGSKGPLLEIGSYRGKSSIYLGAAARASGTILYSIDHHRGSEEHQPGEGFHDPKVFDEGRGRVDTLPSFLDTISSSGLTDVVAPLVGTSNVLAPTWTRPLGLVFIDGGHSEGAAQADFEGWAPKVIVGGSLAIHDVFEDPSEGGRPPYNVYRRALDEGNFIETGRCGSLRVLERIRDRV
jgi:predicted O-methyltransferase YrrM